MIDGEHFHMHINFSACGRQFLLLYFIQNIYTKQRNIWKFVCLVNKWVCLGCSSTLLWKIFRIFKEKLHKMYITFYHTQALKNIFFVYPINCCGFCCCAFAAISSYVSIILNVDANPNNVIIFIIVFDILCGFHFFCVSSQLRLFFFVLNWKSHSTK